MIIEETLRTSCPDTKLHVWNSRSRRERNIELGGKVLIELSIENIDSVSNRKEN